MTEPKYLLWNTAIKKGFLVKKKKREKVAIRFEQVHRFILAKKNILGLGAL